MMNVMLSPITEHVLSLVEKSYEVNKRFLGQELHPDISWRPTCFWKNPREIIACEISEDNTNLSVLEVSFGQLIYSKLFIRVLVAFPRPSNNEQWALYRLWKSRGIGIVFIDLDNIMNSEIDYNGIPLKQYIPPIELNGFNKKLRAKIQNAYNIYMQGNPQSGVQNLGKTIELIIKGLAIQSRGNGKFKNGGFKPLSKKHYAYAKLVDDLLKENIIDNAILGYCRAFCDIRNDVSHPPDTKAKEIKIEYNIKNYFETGLNILERLPEALKDKGYKLQL